jgi:hypothetical protein
LLPQPPSNTRTTPSSATSCPSPVILSNAFSTTPSVPSSSLSRSHAPPIGPFSTRLAYHLRFLHHSKASVHFMMTTPLSSSSARMSRSCSLASPTPTSLKQSNGSCYVFQSITNSSGVWVSAQSKMTLLPSSFLWNPSSPSASSTSTMPSSSSDLSFLLQILGIPRISKPFPPLRLYKPSHAIANSSRSSLSTRFASLRPQP